MSRSSEEVLLIINQVRYKKVDGALYLMAERMAWMQEGKDTFAVSHLYAEIKLQKISPDNKDKVQLQVVMHDGSANTFHFNNPMGRAAQIQDRDSAKELLQQLLPQFKRKISSELEEKNRLLQEDPELFQLYKNLVVGQVITAEEFWASRAHKFSNTSKNGPSQTVGVSPAFLADIKPQTDGCNGLKYNLTADIIESVFKTYPMVKKKHAEYVPHKMTETEFWTRFFQSHYFHRDRINLSSKDLFYECAKNDDEVMKSELNKQISDPLVDLTEIKDNSLDEGYRGVVEDKRVSTNTSNQSMIRRFNQHSTMVLRACESQSLDSTDHAVTSGDKSNGTNGIRNGEVASTSTSIQEAEPPSKKARIQEKLSYEDLEREQRHEAVNLRLERLDRYLHGPTPITTSQYSNASSLMPAIDSIGEEIHDWEPQLPFVLPSGGQAIGVLGELSPGGALMHGTSQQQLHQMVPPEIQEELRLHYKSLCELLRHFWSSFPTSSKFLEEKVLKMRSTLERFQLAKLNPLKDKITQSHYSVNLTGHMEEILQAAYNKFDIWQTRRMMRR